jgi:UDP-N-acetylmuramoyl-L-alanyl-D-glutamate--2,6-diaminopimelate ligase
LFRAAVFTNISQDHLDFHNDIDDYVNEKKKLFNMLSGNSYGISNKDDTYSHFFEKATDKPVLTYSINSKSNFKADDIKISVEGVIYNLDYSQNITEVKLNLTGYFNVYNSLAAFVLAYNEGVPVEVIKDVLKKTKGVSGRFEKIECGQDFTVIVDYAHTPDSLKNILKTVEEFADNRIITVFGCGGDRDRLKRPQMGEEAAQHSDFCIITSDNPRSEDPKKIIEDIIPGVKKYTKNYLIEIDRKAAIEKALKICEKHDILIIAGKGHETYQEINGTKISFDDKLIVKEYFNNGEKNV